MKQALNHGEVCCKRSGKWRYRLFSVVVLDLFLEDEKEDEDEFSCFTATGI